MIEYSNARKNSRLTSTEVEEIVPEYGQFCRVVNAGEYLGSYCAMPLPMLGKVIALRIGFAPDESRLINI